MAEISKINEVIASFYNCFTNKYGRLNPEAMYEICIPEAIIIKKMGKREEVYNLDTFMNPRIEILTNGSLVDFEEREVSHNTEVFQKHGSKKLCLSKIRYALWPKLRPERS